VRTLRILAVGAHPDDVELGCGGVLALFKKKGHEVNILVLTRGEASGDPAVRENECKLAASIIGADDLRFGNLADTKVTDGIESVRVIENSIDAIGPDFLFTHSSKDSHQDHRNTHFASMSAARNASRVLLYESPAALRDFSPQAFVDISTVMNLKMRIVEVFESQGEKTYVNGRNGRMQSSDPCVNCEKYGHLSNAIAGLARFRGFQAGVGLAEAFEVARYVIDVQLFPVSALEHKDQARLRSGRISQCTTIQTSLT
jgi:LmbE family N-acetylglucosaminyl deacetylase